MARDPGREPIYRTLMRYYQQAGDTVAAQALLAGADSVLREVDDPALHGARRAVAADLAVWGHQVTMFEALHVAGGVAW